MLSASSDVQVTPGREGDLDGLTDLYNHYVRETAVTFDTRPFTAAERRPWLLSHPEDGPHRLMVARAGHPSGGSTGNGSAVDGSAGNESAVDGSPGRILGYATSSPFRAKPAYATSVEVSVYCAPAAGGRGIGTLLYKALFEALAEEDLHRAYAGVALPNEPSLRLHARFGFEPVGTYRQVGRKFGRYWDVAWYEKRLDG